ncbi:uncharacterized protein LOC104884486 [Beta vulgaris subsp. vulgaris]|uniref:uncharacterized protein LOC104884486 n=1 Tax=Beta vulgaris subsp. vulgaris TaxID=3555 RepID=UPI0025492D20|nr:uncharacterized protein LOC104884486 [Beta vulgaris subsp. vulgaris]
MTPFSREIVDTPTQGKIKTPLIEQFTDPEDHMATYKAQMSMQTSCEATWCRFFPTTLKGLALNWFQELPAGIITDFAVLEDMFTNQFVAGKRQNKTNLHLMGVKQEKNESLADYIKRFNEESLKVFDLQDEVAFAALMSGLQPPGRLRWTLAESEVKTFSEAMTKAQRFIQAADICRHSQDGGKKRKEEGIHRDQPKQQKIGGRSDRFTDHGNDPRFNRNRREIYLDIKKKSMLPHPPPIRTSAYRRDKSQCCEYHRECGHTTKDCRELKKGLDNLVDQGKLKRYLKHSIEEKGKLKVGQSNSGDMEGFIGVIAGGFASGGLTGRARKAHLQNLKHQVLDVQQGRAYCPVMTFGESGRSVSVPHDDPLVIELKVANTRVKRVLVDSGSSADIITLECLKKLKYSERDVTPLDHPLIGFGKTRYIRSALLSYPLGWVKRAREEAYQLTSWWLTSPYHTIQ